MRTHTFSDLPKIGAWRLAGAYDGFEITQFVTTQSGITITGTSMGIEGAKPWHLTYVIQLSASWHIKQATITSANDKHIDIKKQGEQWVVNGKHQANLDGCIDLDLEASAVTNTIPVHRLALGDDQKGASLAAYVRTHTLAVETLDQTYHRIQNKGNRLVFDYESPRFGYHDKLVFTADGLIHTYPSIAERIELHP